MRTSEAADVIHPHEWLPTRSGFAAACIHENASGRVKGLPFRRRAHFLRCVEDGLHLAVVEAS